MNTYQDKRENVVVEPEQPVIVEPSLATAERNTGFLHSLGERIGLVSPIPDATHFSKEPGLEQHTTYVTNDPTTINGAEHTDRILLNEQKKPSFTEMAKDYVYGAGEWIGLVANKDDRLSNPTFHEAAEHAAFSDKAHDKMTEAERKAGLVEKPAYEKAEDKLTEAGRKVGVVEKPAYEKVEDKLTEAGRKVGILEKPANEKAKDKLYEARDSTYEAAEEARLGQKSFTEKAKDYIYGVGERTGVVSSHPDMDRAKDNLNEAGQRAGIVRQKSYPEMAADKFREVGEKVGIISRPLPIEPSTDLQKALFNDFTEMEGQKPFMDVRTAEEITKTLPA